MFNVCKFFSVVAVMALLSACVGSNSTTSTATPGTTTSTSSGTGNVTVKIGTAWAFTQYTSSQFHSTLPAYTVTRTSSADDTYFLYSVGYDTTSSSAVHYPLGRTVAIDPSLLADGTQFIYLRGGAQGGPSTNVTMNVSLFPTVADGYYVGVRTISSASGKQEVRAVRYAGARNNNNIVNGVLTLADAADGAAPRSLTGSTTSPISASLYNSKVAALELAFGQGTDYIRASGGYGSGDTGGYCDHMVLQYNGVDPVLGQITGSIYLYRVRSFDQGGISSTIGVLNASGTLKNVATGTTYGVKLIGETFDNYKLAGYLLLTDFSSNKVLTCKAVGKAGRPDGSSNGILFSSTDNSGFYGFLTFGESADGVRTINQMTIHSSLQNYAPLDSFVAAGPSVSLLQPFVPWP